MRDYSNKGLKKHKEIKYIDWTFILNVFNDAWQRYKNNLFSISIDMILFAFIISITLLIPFVNILLLPAFVLGYAIYLLKVYNGHTGISSIFEGFKRYGTAWGIFLFMAIIYSFVSFPPTMFNMGTFKYYTANSGNFNESALIYFAILVISIILTSVIQSRTAYMFFLVAEQKIKIIDSLYKSLSISKKRFLTLIIAFILANIILYTGIFLFFIGSLFTLPFSGLVVVSMYKHLLEEYEEKRQIDKKSTLSS